jgi:hypothetical protein
MDGEQEKLVNELSHDKALEEEAKRLGSYDLHPLITKVHSKLGAFNLIRNAANKRQVDIGKIGEEEAGG